MSRPLEGVKVIELGIYAASPWTGRLFADMGADVIKIESPEGDPHRKFGLSISTICDPDENPCYQLYNGGKKNLCLNLKTEEGKKVLFKLLEEADIFYSNIRYKALMRMGISYEDLKDRFPGLVYGHLSGYGLKGKDSELPGFDASAFFARSGYMLDAPYEGSGPLSMTYGLGDNTAATYLATGLLAALHKRTVTGKGDFVLVSLYGSAISSVGLMLVTQNEGPGYNEKWPQDRMKPPTPVCTTYLTKDGAVSLALLNHVACWPGFCRAVGLEELIDDDRYKTPQACKQPENSTSLVTRLTELFKTRETSYWAGKLSEQNLPYSIPQHMKDVFKDDQAWDNSFITKYTFPNGNKRYMPNIPIQFQENKAVNTPPAEKKGESTRGILAEAGFTENEVDQLFERRIVY